MKKQGALIFCLLAVQAVYGQILPYDCRTSACAADDCNAATPDQCEGGTPGSCTSAFNYDCGSSADQEADVPTNCPACDATGTFSCADAPTPACTCKEGYTGATCADNRIRATCSNAGIDITVSPYEGAAFGTNGGNIHFLTDSLAATPTPGTHAPDCAFTDGAELTVTDYPYTTAATAIHASCPTAVADTTTTPTSPTYTLTFYIQYTGLYTDADQEVQVTCTQPDPGATPVVADVTVAGITNPSLTALTVAEDIESGATLGIYLASDTTFSTNLAGTFATPATTPLTAGTEVHLVFEMEVGLVYDDLGVMSIVATGHDPDGMAPATPVTVTLMDDGCVPAAIARLVTGVTKALDTTPTPNVVRIEYKMKAFALPGGGPVYIRSQICPITTGDATCTLTRGTGACSSVGSAAVSTSYVDTMLTPVTGRKKRQAQSTDETTTDVRSIDVALIITDPINYQSAALAPSDFQENETSAECYESLAFILPLVLLSVILVAAVVMAMFFCMKLSKSQDRHVESATNMAYK